MRFNEFKLRQWEEEHIKKFPKRIRAYDVVIEVKNIQAESKEEAKRQALDLITSPSLVDVKIEDFEHKSLDELLVEKKVRRWKNEEKERIDIRASGWYD